jgi:hypothetical protein
MFAAAAQGARPLVLCALAARRRTTALAAAAVAASLALSALPRASAQRYSPDSPEVVAMVAKGLKFLETATDDRLGAQCLIALAFHKNGAGLDHPRIVEAVRACRTSIETERLNHYIYSKALAVILLAELDSSANEDLLRDYAKLLEAHQKDHGGFGYTNMDTGDTSQTQYLALAYWELLNHGISPDASSVQKCLKWLMRTQDPSGGWGYQGTDPGGYERVPQLDSLGRSMTAAGMGSTMILGNALGLLKVEQPKSGDDDANETSTSPISTLPPALRRADEKKRRARAPTLPAGDVELKRLTDCLARARAWQDKNFGLDLPSWQFYYLYSVERYKSFEELVLGPDAPQSDWYDRGVEFLRGSQREDGSWLDSCDPPCATAFATLFLLRSTQQSIKASLGEGTLIGGRGLPRDLSKVRLQNGRLVVQQNATELDELLDMMEEGDSAEFDALASNPAALEVTEVTPEAARRLQQVVRSGPPQARLLAVRALAKARSIDYAPTLIFALTDPDNQVVRAARDGLRSVSRSFEGFGPPDNFTKDQQDEAVVRWKEWYQTIRPDAAPLP